MATSENNSIPSLQQQAHDPQSSESTEMDAACEVIGQLMEPCEKCGKIANGGRLILPTDWEMPLCEECHNDSESLIAWFASELEAAMSDQGEATA
jgi:hypothetical protein